MKFDELQETIPYARYGKPKSLTMQPYGGVTLALPGRHAEDTTPKGGDFVVMVTDPVFRLKDHQFTHTDIFNDVQSRAYDPHFKAVSFIEFYRAVVQDGTDPLTSPFTGFSGVMDPCRFFCAAQCLAVAEHRRYARYEAKFGGRFLPFRFAAGIAENLWTAADATAKQRRGRPGVEWLERDCGVPEATQKMFDLGET